MSQERKSIFGFITFLGILGGLIAGFAVRSWIEIGPSLPEARTAGMSVKNLLASADDKVPLSDAEYFYQLTQKLEQDYVEPIADKSVLGTGAVRGMIGSLSDPSSLYYDEEGWTIFQERQQGKMRGIGVDLELRFNAKELEKLRKSDRSVDQLLLIPDLFVANVALDSPADKAGIRAGDQVIGVNGSWVMSGTEIDHLRHRAQKADGEEMTKIRSRMSELAEKSMLPARAEQELTHENSGTVIVLVRRGGQEIKSSVTRTELVLNAVQDRDGAVDINLIRSTRETLKAQLGGSKRLDLRGEMNGGSELVVPILQTLIGGGEYGTISQIGRETKRPISGQGSEVEATGWTVLVDEFTSGAALVIARTMEARGAKVEGKNSRAMEWIESVPLESGGGYTLVTGIFEATRK